MIYSLAADISKDEFSTCLLRWNLTKQTHQVVARKSFANKESGFKACLTWARRRIDDPSASLRVTMEATGVYYEPLALYIQTNEPDVHLAVVLPSKAKQYMASQGLRSKTDKIDAFGLALMGAERKLSAWEGIDPFWQELRATTRTRARLQDQRTQMRNQLHALEAGGRASAESKQALQTCIATLNQQIKQLAEQIRKHLSKREELTELVAYLKSIPGIGLLTIAVVLAETNGFKRFDSISQLISFSGYDVVIRKSGQWQGKSKISKQGSSYIRRAMYMPASAAIRSDSGPIVGFYRRLLGKHHVKMKAHVAVQKKLLTYMYVLAGKQEYFDPQHIRNLQKHHNNVAPSRKHSEEATVDTSVAA